VSPLRDDYVVRQLRIIAAMIARMTGLRLDGQFDEAKAQLEEAYGLLLGERAGLIRAIDARTAAQLVGSKEGVLALADLVAEEAEQEPDESRRALLRERAAALRGLGA
jgi:hypothetical protein